MDYSIKFMDIRQVIKLQEHEEALMRLKRAVDGLKEEEINIEEKMKELDRVYTDVLEELYALEGEITKVEEKIQECKRGMERSERLLSVVKRAEDYKKALRERAINEDCVIKLSRELQTLQSKREALRERLKNLSKELERERKRLVDELHDVRDDLERVSKKLQEEELKVKELRESVDKETLSEYDRLKSELGLPVVVKVDSFRSCGGCGMVLPSALYSQLIFGKLVKCPNCGRFVYYEA